MCRQAPTSKPLLAVRCSSETFGMADLDPPADDLRRFCTFGIVAVDIVGIIAT